MGAIVCATGNGIASRSVQSAAVDLAQRQGRRLIFLHVVDVSRLGEIEEGLVPSAQRELAWLGQATLRLAQERARRRGVDADIAIRFGQVQAALEQFIQEEQAEVLLLGQPTDDALRAFANTIEVDTGIPVQLVTAEQAGTGAG